MSAVAAIFGMIFLMNFGDISDGAVKGQVLSEIKFPPAKTTPLIQKIPITLWNRMLLYYADPH